MSEKMIVACPECETRFVAPLEKFLPNGRKVRCAKCGHAWFQTLEGTDAQSVATSADPVAQTSTPVPPELPAEKPTESIMDRAARATAKHPSTRPAEPMSEPMTGDGTSAIATTTAAAASMGAGASAIAAKGFDRVDGLEGNADAPTILNDAPKRKRSFWPRALLYSLAAAIIAGALGYFFKDEISAQIPALDPPLTSWKNTVDGIVSKAVPSNRALKIENVKYDLSASAEEPTMLLTADVANESGSVQAAPKLTATIYAADNAVLKTVGVSPEEPVTEIEAQTSLTYFLKLPYPPEGLDRVEVDFTE